MTNIKNFQRKNVTDLKSFRLNYTTSSEVYESYRFKDQVHSKIDLISWSQFIFCYKELSVDENNTFTVDITEKNKVENVRFKNSLECAVTGPSINQDIGSALVTVTDVYRQSFLSNTIPNPETKNIIIPFKKNQQLIAYQ